MRAPSDPPADPVPVLQAPGEIPPAPPGPTPPDRAPADRTPLAAIAFAAGGIALLTAMDAVMKALMLGAPFLQSVFLRFLAGAFVVAALLPIVRPRAPDRRGVIANSWRSLVGVATATSFFFAVKSLPLAEAFTLVFLAPVFVAILGVLMLREVVDRTIVLALVFGFGGVLVIVWPRLGQPLGDAAMLGVIAALFSAVAYAFNLVLLRQLAQRDHPLVIVAFQTGGGALVLAVPALFLWEPLTGAQWLGFAAAGVLGVSGHLALTAAFARAPASRLAPIDYTSLLWATIVGYAFFAEVPTLVTMAGASLIIIGALVAARR